MSTKEFLSRATKYTTKKLEIPETDIEDHYVKHAKNKKCKALKLIIFNKKGFPDRTTLCPGGRILFIEFKRKGKKLKLNQKTIKIILVSFGFEYHTCDVIGQAEDILDKFLKRNL